MADLIDIEDKIAFDVEAAVAPVVGTTYTPNLAVDQAEYGASITIPSVQVFAGDVLLRTLMTRLEANKAQIGILSDGVDLKVDQFLTNQQFTTKTPTPVIVATTTGDACTFTGAIQAGDVVGLQFGLLTATYKVQASDTFTTIAAALAAAAVANGITASSSGPTITVPPTAAQYAQFNVGGQGTVGNVVWRRRHVFHATLWFPDRFTMSAVGKAVQAMYPPGTVLTLYDDTSATVLSMDSFDLVDQQRDGTWLRRIRWMIDFVSTNAYSATQVVAVSGSLQTEPPLTLTPFTAPTASQL